MFNFQVVMSDKQTPGLALTLLQILQMIVVEDLLFFTFHRCLHSTLLYKYHKVHHEYTYTVSTAALHFHPIEFFLILSLSSFINIRLTMLISPLHITTLTIWFMLRICDVNIAHSGYKFPWAPIQLLPFCTNDEFHDYHHTRGYGNYGSFLRVWDSVFGYNREFRTIKREKLLTVLVEEEKEELLKLKSA
jgi:sterol desaturase/sphingolipid hydroxylase (fatty acid hydroxylase superfamily)